jgi:hypothetical protein
MNHYWLIFILVGLISDNKIRVLKSQLLVAWFEMAYLWQSKPHGEDEGQTESWATAVAPQKSVSASLNAMPGLYRFEIQLGKVLRQLASWSLVHSR